MMKVITATLAIGLHGSAVFADDVGSSVFDHTSQIDIFERFKDCEKCPEMIVLPIGSFMMGAIEGESQNPFDVYGPGATGRIRTPDKINIIPSEHPRHRVQVDIPFAMSINVITIEEWSFCVADGACLHAPEPTYLGWSGMRRLGPDHPVVNVSYLDIQEYLSWLNANTGSTAYRLPTEAEWEFAARSGTNTRFAQGNELDSSQANFSVLATENVLGRAMPHLIDRQTLVSVHELDSANAWGLRHMSGNVAEITMSCWTDTILAFHRPLTI